MFFDDVWRFNDDEPQPKQKCKISDEGGLTNACVTAKHEACCTLTFSLDSHVVKDVFEHLDLALEIEGAYIELFHSFLSRSF